MRMQSISTLSRTGASLLRSIGEQMLLRSARTMLLEGVQDVRGHGVIAQLSRIDKDELIEVHADIDAQDEPACIHTDMVL